MQKSIKRKIKPIWVDCKKNRKNNFLYAKIEINIAAFFW